MNFREALQLQMLQIMLNKKTRFIGYNTKNGPKMSNTLRGCEESCIETPVCENLMCGLAMGLALEGFIPILCFERMDFTLVAADALINQIYNLQRYGLKLNIAIRMCIGTNQPLDPGSQHVGDYTWLFEKIGFHIIEITPHNVDMYSDCIEFLEGPTIFTERRADYDKPISLP